MSFVYYSILTVISYASAVELYELILLKTDLVHAQQSSTKT